MNKHTIDKLLVAFVLLVLGTVGAMAMRADGFTTEVVDAHDGTAWLLNGDTTGPILMSVNGITRETSVQRSLNVDSQSTLDVHQNGNVAFLEAAGSLFMVDASTASISTEQLNLPGGESANVAIGGDTVATWTNTGELHLAATSSLRNDLAPDQGFDFDGPIDVAVSANGVAWVLNYEASTLTPISDSQELSDPIPFDGTSLEPGVTVAGETAVVFTQDNLIVVDNTFEADSHPYNVDGPIDILRLQSPGATARLVNGQPSVVASTSAGLSAFSLVDGQVRHVVELPFPLRNDIDPVVAGKCAYGVGEQLWVHACEDRDGVSEATDQTMIQPRLRVVRDLVFFEDWQTQTVSVWAPGANEPAEIEPLAPDAAVQEEECSVNEICAQGQDDAEGNTGSGLSGIAAGEIEEIVEDGVDEPPVAIDDNFTLVTNESQVWDVLANDQEPDGQQIGLTIGTVDPGLSVVPLADRRVAVSTTSPAGSQLTFTYRATDGRFQSEPATVSIEVVSTTDDTPVLVNDRLTVAAGSSQPIQVLANDIDDETLTLLEVAVPATFSGQVTSEPSGWVWVSPTDADIGTHNIEYLATDGSQEGRSTLEVEVIANSQLSPTATTDFVQVPWGTVATVDLTANDIDPNGDQLTLSGPPRLAEGQQWASLTPVDATTFQITTLGEEPEETRHAVWEYTVSDGQGASDEGLLRVAIIPPPQNNRPPVAVDDHVRIAAGQSAEINILRNDRDPDPLDIFTLGAEFEVTESGIDVTQVSPTTIQIVTAPSVPAGIHQIRYSISDSAGDTSTGTILVLIPELTDENLPPAINDGRAISLIAGQATTVALSEPGIISDPEGRTLDVSNVRVSNGPPATVQLTGNPGNYQIQITASLESLGTAEVCLLYTSPSPRDRTRSRMPSSA